MGYLINDNLIWIVNPKCASNSIENALLNSNLKLKKYFTPGKETLHAHIPLYDCLEQFGNNESICITRHWFERWLSALHYIWDVIEIYAEYTPIHKWEEVNNEIIYNIFDNEFLNKLHSFNDDSFLECFKKLLKNDTKNIIDIHNQNVGIVGTLISEKYYKSNQKCTYEFDIKNIDKFASFIENKFGEKLIIEKKNQSTKRPNKIIINDELKQFVWDKFEKRFEKRNELI